MTRPGAAHICACIMPGRFFSAARQSNAVLRELLAGEAQHAEGDPDPLQVLYSTLQGPCSCRVQPLSRAELSGKRVSTACDGGQEYGPAILRCHKPNKGCATCAAQG